MNATRRMLPDGRAHFQHGPIDLVIGADGDAQAVAAAHDAAWQRFEGVLAELVGELPGLRSPILLQQRCMLDGPVARRMWHACEPHAAAFITPMAAVAGAVAEEIVAFYRRAGVRRAWVNNGGDIALHLAAEASVRVGLVADLARVVSMAGPLPLDARFVVDAAMPVRGIATSGWRGRSFSLGIADSVTVLASHAAVADAAATMIANAVDLPHPGIVRQPARELRDDSDLRDIAVTVDVPALSPDEADAALAAGRRHAARLQADGLIVAAMLCCQGRFAWVAPRATAVTSAAPPLHACPLAAMLAP